MADEPPATLDKDSAAEVVEPLGILRRVDLRPTVATIRRRKFLQVVEGRTGLARQLANPSRSRDRPLRLHQQLLQPAPQVRSHRLEITRGHDQRRLHHARGHHQKSSRVSSSSSFPYGVKTCRKPSATDSC